MLIVELHFVFIFLNNPAILAMLNKIKIIKEKNAEHFDTKTNKNS